MTKRHVFYIAGGCVVGALAIVGLIAAAVYLMPILFVVYVARWLSRRTAAVR